MCVKLLTEHHLYFLSLKGGGTGSSESTLVKMSHCWKSHVAAHYRITQSIVTVNHEYTSRLSVQYRPQDYNTFFILNSTEHELSTAHKS